MMPPRIEHVFSLVEFISIFIVFLACFFIFYKTREIYFLTSHKGIGYFRKAFLFFGISSSLFLVHTLLGPGAFYFRNTFKFFMIFNLIAILYFLFSLFYKKLKYEWMIYFFAFFVMIFSFLIKSKLVLLIFGFSIFMTIGVVSIKNYLIKDKKKNKIGTHIYLVYCLLFGLWIFNFIYRILDLDYFFGREVTSFSIALVFVYISWIVFKNLSISGNKK